MVTLYAVDEIGYTEKNLLKESLAHSRSGPRLTLDRNPATWESLTARLQLPAGTQFVVVKVSVCRIPKDKEPLSSLPNPVRFDAHFVDDVRASILVRKVVSAQRD